MTAIQAIPRARVAALSPYYNREHAIDGTLRSLVEQTFSDMRIVFWDDQSKDNTWDNLKVAQERLNDERISVYQNPQNMGLYKGLNHAITYTDSEFVAIVGSGDICAPERIARQVEALENNPGAVFCATASITSDPVTGQSFSDTEFHKSVITIDDMRERSPFTHGSVMFRRSALEMVGLYEECFRWCGDWDLFFRLLEHGNGIFLEDVLYFRVAQSDGASFNPQRAFEQISYKHLALKLSTVTSPDQRKSIINQVRAGKLAEVLEDRKPYVSRDLARRNIKIYLMGRSKSGDEMLKMSVKRDVVYPRKYRVFVSISRVLSRVPLPANFLINLARKLPR